MKVVMKYILVGSCMLLLFGAALQGCATTTVRPALQVKKTPAPHYVIGPGDELEIYVRDNPDLTVTVPVRPDGRISIPLIQDIQAGGKTPGQLANNIETLLRKYIREPIVTVIVTKFVGAFSEQIRVVGQAAQPKAISYRQGMTLLDVLIEVGGLTKYADGNDAKVVRHENGNEITMSVHLGDLLNGDMRANMPMQPGDILIIPESTF